MKYNRIREYKNFFIVKIKQFFKRVFGYKEKQYTYVQQETITENNERQSNFIDNIRTDEKTVNFVIDKKKFLEEINGNEEALNMLSIDRLKKLERYYDSVIAENEKKLRKLKATE